MDYSNHDLMARFNQEFSASLSKLGISSGNIGIACSGGSDSMALTLCLHHWQREHKEYEIKVAIVDHGLRSESAKEALSVKQVLASNGIACEILQSASPIKPSQASARNLRYFLLSNWAREHQILAITLAHHLDDQVETIFMRLSHHSGFTGLVGMKAVQMLDSKDGFYKPIYLIRPLLSFTKSSLIDLVNEHKLPFVSDPSNYKLKYERVRWRKAMPDLVKAGFSPQSMLRLGQVASQFSQQQSLIFAKIFAESIQYYPLLGVDIDLNKIEKYGQELSQAFIGWLWHKMSRNIYPIRSKTIIRTLDDMKKGGLGGSLAGLIWRKLPKAKKKNHELSIIRICREVSAIAIAIRIDNHTNHYLWDERYCLTINSNSNALTNALNWEEVSIYYGAVSPSTLKQFIKEHKNYQGLDKKMLLTTPCLFTFGSNNTQEILFMPSISYIEPKFEEKLIKNHLEIKIDSFSPFSFTPANLMLEV